MRNKTLLSLLGDYRSEIHASDNPAHNSSVRDAQVQQLRSTQEWLWEKHDWPHLRVRRYLDLNEGQRYYDTRAAKYEDGTPATDLGIQRLEKVDLRRNADWVDMFDGLDDTHRRAYDSDLDQRGWPSQRWQVYEDEQFEVWPIPSQNFEAATLDGRMRLTGIRDLRPLVADDDRCDLDDKLIYKYAAAKYLARAGSKDAQVVLDEARVIENSQTANFSKRRSFNLGGRLPHEGRLDTRRQVVWRT